MQTGRPRAADRPPEQQFTRLSRGLRRARPQPLLRDFTRESRESSPVATQDALKFSGGLELLTRAVILVAGMNLAEPERAAVLTRVIADLASPTTQIPG